MSDVRWLASPGLSGDRHRHFFDWASTSPLSDEALRWRDRYLARSASALDTPQQLRLDTAALSGLREAVGKLVGASATQQVVLGRSVSELMTLISYGLPAERDRNRVVVSDLDHHAAVMPWLGHVDRRWQVVVAPSDGRGVVDLDACSKLIDDRTAVVSVTHLSHIHGTVQPVAELARMARDAGAISVIDGAQAVGRLSVDSGRIVSDLYLAVARKALRGSLGAGFVVGSRRVLQTLRPLLISTRAGEIEALGDPDRFGLKLRDIPERLEGNLPDMAALHAMWGAIEAVAGQDSSATESHCSAVMPDLVQDLQRMGFRPSVPPSSSTSGIATLRTPEGTDGRHVQDHLRDAGYVVAATEDTIRVSVHLSNSIEDVKNLVKEVTSAVRS